MKEEQGQLLRFIAIGLVSTALYFIVLLSLRPVIPSTIVLTAICYALSMCFNFLAQGLFTFQLKRLSPRQLVRYLIMHGGALTVNSLSMALLVDGWGVPLLVAQICVTGGLTVATFLVSKTWVYA